MSLLKQVLAKRESRPSSKDVNQLLIIIENISHIRDLDTLLKSVLYEARRFVGADAGTIYLKSGKHLLFSYVQNDTLFKGETARDKYAYSRGRMEISKKSLAGYVALTGDSLLIDDVYDIKSDVSYAFNPVYDLKTSYRTRSILVVPLMTRDEVVLGVLQLINAKNEEDVVPFSMQDKLYITQFAQNAATAIEKAQLSQQMVLRMVDMTELRDPYETIQHARRVGAYSIELFRIWADRHSVSEQEISQTQEVLRTAAILHDVGKIAVSDTVLKKQGELTYEERMQIRYHTIHGARLFKYISSSWDKMAREVALNHHEHWDGRGYPGKIENINAPRVYFGPGKRGSEIPLPARIVALADVYDALISERAYKPAWKREHALNHIRHESGRHFDPEVVDIFLSIQDVIQAIRSRYPD
jgi:HD-GYP domain-containing protein (c-di-GMP phosphodiesterase class II)